MPVETKTTEQKHSNGTEAFGRAEETIGTMFDGSLKTMQAVFNFNRTQFNTTLEMGREMQQESLRLADAWLDQMTRFQKNTLKTMQDYSHKYQDVAERAVKENQVRFEESVDQTINLVTPAARRR
jgi:hypothetical protein